MLCNTFIKFRRIGRMEKSEEPKTGGSAVKWLKKCDGQY